MERIKEVLKGEGYEWKDVGLLWKKSIIGYILNVINLKTEGGEEVKEGHIVFECRFEIFRQAAAANIFRNLDREKEKDAFLKCLKTRLQNVTLLAAKTDCKPDQHSRPVSVRHGCILGIYVLQEQKKGYIRSNDGTVIEFSQDHFAAEFPFPLRVGDDVSFLVERRSLKARTKEDAKQEILPGSIRVTTYNEPIDLATVKLNEFIHFLKDKGREDHADIMRHIIESRCLPFLRGIFHSIEKINSEDVDKTIMAMIKMFASCVSVRFPIGSEQEKDYNTVFNTHNEKSVDPGKQKRFLEIFIGCRIFGYISETKLDDQPLCVQACKIILALLAEFPEEREYICNPVIKLVSSVQPHERGKKIWNLIFFVISRPRADVYNQSWRNIPEMMSLAEFHARLQPKSAAGSHEPKLKAVKATYASREEYCDTYYKLLREDTYRELSSAVNRWIRDRPKDDSDAVYDIEFCGIEESGTGAQGCNCCRIHCDPLTSAVRQEGKEHSRFLRCGNLFCISPSGKFRSDVKGDVLFAIKEPEMRKFDRYRTILLRFLPGFGDLSEIKAIQSFRSSKKSIMIESPVFFKAYEPVLQALQAMNTHCLPFESELLRCEPKKFASEYMDEETMLDIAPFLSKHCPEPRRHPVGEIRSVLTQESEAKQCTLDVKQIEAVDCILRNRLAIIQGPPGTGKTFLASRVVHSLLSLKKTPIVIMAYKNRALDHLLEECHAFCEGRIVRLGRLSEDYAEGVLRECLLYMKLKGKCGKKLPQTVALERKLDSLLRSIKDAWGEVDQILVSEHKLKFGLDDCWRLLQNDTENRKELLSTLFKEKSQLKKAAEREKFTFQEWKQACTVFQNVISLPPPPSPPLSRFMSVPSTITVLNAKENSSNEKQASDPVKGDESGATLDSTLSWGMSVPSTYATPNAKDNSSNEKGASDPVKDDESGATLARTISRSMSVSSTNATPNAKENSSNEKGASVPADGDESGEEIEKERNLDCKDDDDIDTDREDEDIKGGNETKRPGNPRSISIDEAEKAVKAAMNSYKHTASNENKKEFFRKFHNYLVAKRYEAAMSELEELTRDFNATSDKLKDLKVPVKVEILREAQIVAMTTTKAAIEHKLLNMLQPQIIVMEEGGGVLEPNLLACIPPSTKHLIVIGDHKQIGPTVVSEELQKELKFGVSLLERLVDPNRRRLECNAEQGGFPHVTLNTQCRMNSELLDLFQTDYGEGFKLRTRKVGHQDFQPPACMKGCKVWWSYEKGSLEQKRQGKVFNPKEARMVASYSYWLFSEGFNAEEVALLTPYSAQVSEIKDAINAICLNARVSKDHVKHFESFQGRVFTVDSFQGHECDIVILSLVRNNNQSKIGFLSDETRQVVALSRQRRALCIIACEEHMSKSPSWRKRRKAFNFGDKDLQKLPFGEDEVSTPDQLNQRVTKQLACGRRKKQYLPSIPNVLNAQQQSMEENDHPVQEGEHYAIPLTAKSAKELQYIAEVVGADWKGVMRKVADMTQNEIKKICANERDVIEQGVYALNKWVENSSKGCTLGQILRVLPKGQQKEIISKIEKIRTSSYSR